MLRKKSQAEQDAQKVVLADALSRRNQLEQALRTAREKLQTQAVTIAQHHQNMDAVVRHARQEQEAQVQQLQHDADAARDEMQRQAAIIAQHHEATEATVQQAQWDQRALVQQLQRELDDARKEARRYSDAVSHHQETMSTAVQRARQEEQTRFQHELDKHTTALTYEMANRVTLENLIHSERAQFQTQLDGE